MSEIEIDNRSVTHLNERKYWRNKLSGDVVFSCFPTDLSIEESDIYKIKTSEINGDLYNRICKVTNGSLYRMYMLLTASVTGLLCKYNGINDIIVTSPIEKQVIKGDFINKILPIRISFDKINSYKDLLIETQKFIIEATKNQNYPVSTIINEKQESSEIGPMLPTVVLLENIHDKQYIEEYKPYICFRFKYEDNRILLTIEYKSTLYEEDTVNNIVKYFVFLLNECLINADNPFKELNLIDRNERERLLVELNSNKKEFPNYSSFYEIFEEIANSKSNSIAVVEKETKYTYIDLSNKVNIIAQRLFYEGVRKETVVALMGHRTIEMVSAILAVLKVGGTYLPINGQDPVNRIQYILKDSKAAFLLTQKDIINNMPKLLSSENNVEKVILIDHLQTLVKELDIKDEILNDLSPENSAYIIYTSGSTGNPKGVVVEHKSLINYILWAKDNYVQGDDNMNMPFYSTFSFDMSVSSIFLPLVSGNSIYIYSGNEKEFLLQQVIDDNKVGIIKATPSHLRTIIKNSTDKNNQLEIKKYSNIKRIIVGGENLDSELANKVYRLFNKNVEIYNEYGPTEATVGCMTYLYSENTENKNVVPIGHPIWNTHLYILDKENNVVPKGIMGELYISGVGLAREYINNVNLTNECFIQNPFIIGEKMYKTGDLVKRLEDDNIMFCGRADSQIKIRGYRIEIEEVIKKIKSVKGISDAIVIDKKRNEDTYLHLYYISEEELSHEFLSNQLSKELPDYMIPSFLTQIEEIPLTPNGKLDYKALLNIKEQDIEEIEIPVNDLEKELTRIWSELLGMEFKDVSVTRSFFDLGGHSLSATILISNIHKELDYRIALTQLFITPTIRELAKFLKTQRKKTFQSLIKVEKKEYYPTSPVQKRLYVAQNFDKQSVKANITAALIIEGDIDMSKMEEVFQKLIKRHESLCTYFKIINNQLVQVINRNAHFSIIQNERKFESIDQEVKSLMVPFDLNDPSQLLFRLNFVRIKENKHILVVDLHHIISDGLSLGIIIRESMDIYNNRSLIPLKYQYKDYTIWRERKEFETNNYNQEIFWINEFSEGINYLKLPYDTLEKANINFEGKKLRFSLDNSISSKIISFSNEYNSSLFIVNYTIFNIFLYKITNQEDITVRTITAGRDHSDLNNILGAFINTLAIKNKVKSDYSFIELHEIIKGKIFKCFENQDYQFEDLVSKVADSRDLNSRMISPVGFTFNNVDLLTFNLPGAKVTVHEIDYELARGELFLTVFEQNDKLEFLLEYMTQLFKIETIELFSVIIKDISKIVMLKPDIKIKDIDIQQNIVSIIEEEGHFEF